MSAQHSIKMAAHHSIKMSTHHSIKMSVHHSIKMSAHHSIKMSAKISRLSVFQLVKMSRSEGGGGNILIRVLVSPYCSKQLPNFNFPNSHIGIVVRSNKLKFLKA
uniref:Uncharacterized protein n=1 Tax=Cacopsylla melanoneura TaxID=428564 RepID=A0A8D8PPV7_9HEMI